MRMSSIALCVAVFLFVSYANGTVHAYLDPGTGSMLIQSALALFVGAVTLGRVYWSRLKRLILRRTDRKESLTD
jgi:hypothetical protein